MISISQCDCSGPNPKEIVPNGKKFAVISSKDLNGDLQKGLITQVARLKLLSIEQCKSLKLSELATLKLNDKPAYLILGIFPLFSKTDLKTFSEKFAAVSSEEVKMALEVVEEKLNGLSILFHMTKDHIQEVDWSKVKPELVKEFAHCYPRRLNEMKGHLKFEQKESFTNLLK